MPVIDVGDKMCCGQLWDLDKISVDEIKGCLKHLSRFKVRQQTSFYIIFELWNVSTISSFCRQPCLTVMIKLVIIDRLANLVPLLSTYVYLKSQKYIIMTHYVWLITGLNISRILSFGQWGPIWQTLMTRYLSVKTSLLKSLEIFSFNCSY